MDWEKEIYRLQEATWEATPENVLPLVYKFLSEVGRLRLEHIERMSEVFCYVIVAALYKDED